MRVFVGTPVTEPMLSAINRWRKQHNDLEVRWIEADNLHITFLPPWETEDVEAAKSQLKRFRFKPQLLTLSRLRLGSNPKQLNLIWATGKAKIDLLILKRKLEEQFGFALSENFLPHITLAKFDRNNVPAQIQNLDETVKWQQDIGELVLYKVELNKDGANYTQLAAQKLTLQND